jgi:uncharacterized protein DUF1707
LSWWEAPVTTGPWDQLAAGAPGRGGLRASDADREQVIDALKAAFVQGRLSKEDLEVRAGLALASRTWAELTAITAEIPAAPIEAQLPSQLAWADTRTRANKKVAAWGACAIILPPALGAAFFTFYGGYLVVLLFAFIGLIVSGGPSVPQRPGPLPLRGDGNGLRGYAYTRERRTSGDTRLGTHVRDRPHASTGRPPGAARPGRA